MYSYRLKAEYQEKGLDPKTIYRVAEDGTGCLYLWDDRKIYENGLLNRVDHIKIGWIPSSDKFDWNQSCFVGYSAILNKLFHVNDSTVSLTKDLSDLLVSDQPCNEIKLTNSVNGVDLTADYTKEDAERILYDLKALPNKHHSKLITTGSPFCTDTHTTKKETMLENIIATNKAAATQAAYLEAGRLANATMETILQKKFPMLPQTPFNALIVANLADVIGKQIKPSAKLQKVTQAMVTQAYAEVYQLIDLEGMIGELLNTVGDSFEDA